MPRRATVDLDDDLAIGQGYTSPEELYLCLERRRLDLMAFDLTQYQHYVRAEEARLRLEKSVEEVERHLATATEPSTTSCRLVDVAKHELSLQKAAHDGILECIPPDARRSNDTSVMIDKLANLPELLEAILLELPNSDLFKTMQACRLFNEAITSSARLARNMGLREDLGNRIYFPTRDLWFSGMYCTSEAVEHTMDTPNETKLRVTVVVETSFRRLTLGERCRSMFICQPPIKTIQGFTSCCAGTRFWRHRPGDDRPPAESITSDNGITVGDIVDATLRLKQSHRLCPDASPFDHSADGFVNAHVSFEATIHAAADDPLYVRELKRMLDEKQKHRDRVARQHRIDAYAAAKRTARDQGRPIPTLAEFEAPQSLPSATASNGVVSAATAHSAATSNAPALSAA